ncbi:MAG TPA: efflux RND transporter permease subunit [Gammaproteobacteria bacterium]|nr:efflux RND transporter permease subunit [Gammaproteobacteria bacterium]
MLAAIVHFAIRFRGVVVSLMMLLLAYGVYDLSRTGLDIFPEFSPKLVIVQTESPGLAAEQVEILVTQPVENALSGLIGLKYVRSESIQGLSIVTAIFDDNTNVHLNRQQVSERLAALAGNLPEGVKPPTIVPLESSSATILTMGMTSDRLSLMELRSLADYTVVPRLLSVQGVADVNVFGGEVRQLQIQVLPEKLRRYGLGLEDVLQAARQATGVSAGGFIENDNQRIALRTVGLPITPAELQSVVLTRADGNNVTLRDVANIAYGKAPPIGAAAINGKPGVLLMVIGQYGANTLSVSRRVEAAIKDFQQTLAAQGVQLTPDLFRPANYIETSVHNLSGHLLVGGVFVTLVLFVFLFDLRTAFISALAIPLSLLGAALILRQWGVNLNVMVLGGLAIALGEVVDDAIIDTENIFRRLRENHARPEPLPATEVVFNASMEVRGSVVYASFIVALVFVPLLTLGGVAGRLFSPLGFSYILSILVSLGVALTVTPALCYLLLGRARLSRQDPPVVQFLKPLYARILRFIARKPRFTVLGTLAVCLLGVSVIPTLGGRFLPELREGHYIVHTTSQPGTSLAETLRLGGELTRHFLEIPGVRSVSQWAGRAERSADTYGSHYAEYEVDLIPLSGREQQRVLDQLRAVLSRFPGILYEVNTFLTERVDETVSGYSAPVVVNIYGKDLEVLDAKAREIAAIFQRLPGATDVEVRARSGTPLLQIRPRLDRLSSFGLRPLQVVEAMQTAFEGRAVGKIYEGNQAYDVAVVLDRGARDDPEDVGHLPLRTLDGAVITLAQVADITQTDGRYNILHRGAQRVQTVTGNVTGRDVQSLMKELRTKVHQQVAFDASTYPEFTGSAIEQAQAREELILHSLLAGIGVLMLIYMAVGRFRLVLIMLLNLPFSLLGGVAAAVVTGASLSVGSMVGFVTLFGITVRNSIMLVCHYRHLVEEEGRPWDLDTLVRGGEERLPSILMTALVTALAMLPIAFNSDNPGREIMGPMAAIIVGGLVSSTLLNLLILPTVLMRYGRFGHSRTES